MKLILPALLAVLPFISMAQCAEFTLSDLQAIQRADLDDRQNAILERGFDLRNTVEKTGNTAKRYYKCWSGQEIFEQVVVWHIELNSVMFLTKNEEHYKNLRNAIEGRSGQPVGVNDVYTGRMFQYRFGRQVLDGIDYYSISISQR
jgi:hypothetical protein